MKENLVIESLMQEFPSIKFIIGVKGRMMIGNFTSGVAMTDYIHIREGFDMTKYSKMRGDGFGIQIEKEMCAMRIQEHTYWIGVKDRVYMLRVDRINHLASMSIVN